LLLDEAENAFNVKGKAKDKALATLRNLGDTLSTHEPKCTFMLTAVTREVEEGFADYVALQQRYARVAGAFSPKNPSSPVIDLAELPYDNLEILREIGRKLIDLANKIYPGILEYAVEQENLNRLAEYAESRSFDINHRRLFVKTATWLLDNNGRNSDSKIWSDEQIKQIYDGQVSEILAQDKSDVHLHD
jgi:hypothetical protein